MNGINGLGHLNLLVSDLDRSLVFYRDQLGLQEMTRLVRDSGETWLVYHVWEVTSAGLRGNRRFMWLDRLVWNDGVPDIEGPTREPQARP